MSVIYVNSAIQIFIYMLYGGMYVCVEKDLYYISKSMIIDNMKSHKKIIYFAVQMPSHIYYML